VRSLFRKLRLARYVYHGGETLPDAHTRHCLASYMAIVKLAYNLTVIICHVVGFYDSSDSHS